MDVLQSYHLIPIVRSPTRFPPNLSVVQPTLIDHLWIDFFNYNMSGVLEVDITDHCPVFVFIGMPRETQNKIRCEFRDQSSSNLELFTREIAEIQWDFDDNFGITEKMSNFSNTLNDIYCKHCPIKIKYISQKRKNKPWLTNDILDLVKRKSTYFKMYKRGLISKSQNNVCKNE